MMHLNLFPNVSPIFGIPSGVKQMKSNSGVFVCVCGAGSEEGLFCVFFLCVYSWYLPQSLAHGKGSIDIY